MKSNWKFDTSLDRTLLSHSTNMNAFVLTATVQICLFRSEQWKREEKQLPVAIFDFRYTKVFVAYWFPSNVQRSSKLRQIRAGFYLFNIYKNHILDHRPLRPRYSQSANCGQWILLAVKFAIINKQLNSWERKGTRVLFSQGKNVFNPLVQIFSYSASQPSST